MSIISEWLLCPVRKETTVPRAKFLFRRNSSVNCYRMDERNETIEHALRRTIIPCSFMRKAEKRWSAFKGSTFQWLVGCQTIMRKTELLRTVWNFNCSLKTVVPWKVNFWNAHFAGYFLFLSFQSWNFSIEMPFCWIWSKFVKTRRYDGPGWILDETGYSLSLKTRWSPEVAVSGNDFPLFSFDPSGPKSFW